MAELSLPWKILSLSLTCGDYARRVCHAGDAAFHPNPFR
jgi:hypothetical protein